MTFHPGVDTPAALPSAQIEPLPLRTPRPERATACRLCGGRVESLGRVDHPDPPLVGGVEIDLSDLDINLLACRTCGFQFKDPAVPEERLLECYAKAQGHHWGDRPDPRARKFDILRETLERLAPGRDILDIGCCNGALLEFLGDGWRRYGVEPTEDAVRIARERGVDVLGPTIESLPPGSRFDAATAIDVVEHIVHPLPFFRRVAGLLKPGGILVVLTGDTAAPTFRLQGRRYWYCGTLPEHVSFFRGSAMHAAARESGMRVEHCRRLCHDRWPLSVLARQSAKALVYEAGWRLARAGLRLHRRFDAGWAPIWISARDHLLCVMRKPASR